MAVDRVSFDIGKGETMALVGESGSGKSVTALSVMKLLPYPAAHHPSGSIAFKGQELLTMAERDIRKVRGNDITTGSLGRGGAGSGFGSAAKRSRV